MNGAIEFGFDPASGLEPWYYFHRFNGFRLRVGILGLYMGVRLTLRVSR